MEAVREGRRKLVATRNLHDDGVFLTGRRLFDAVGTEAYQSRLWHSQYER